MRRIPWLLAMTGLASGVSLTCYEQGCDRGTGPRCQIVSPMPAATALSAGPHDCVVIGGAAYCWGANASGQLGDGSTMDSKTPVPVAGGLRFLAVSTGGLGVELDHTCGATSEGVAYCWGANNFGQLGALTGSHSTTPVSVGGGLSFKSVSAGAGFHTCGVTTSGAAYCWGNNFFGQLGDGSGGFGNRSTAAVPVAGELSFVSVSAGGFFTCGVTTAGAAYCWGRNIDGQLGDVSKSDSKTPVLVAGGLSFVSVSAGGSRTCGLTSIGAAYCWGAGLLGDGRTEGSSQPVAVAGALKFTLVSTGFDHSCGLASEGKA